MANAFKRPARVRRRKLKQLGDRDGWICHVCGRAVDSSLTGNHPLQASVDHIVPRSKGGTNLSENLRLAHIRCNTDRDAASGSGPVA